jgi:hypothetical protein
MFTNRYLIRISSLSLLPLLLGLAGLAAGQDPGSAITLAYQFPEGKTMSYRAGSIEKQYMQVNGQDQSIGGTATGGWQVARAWRVLVAATAGSDPFFKSRLEVMAKLAWTQTYLREVR